MKKHTNKALYSIAVTILALYSNASAATIISSGSSVSDSISADTGYYLFAVNNKKVDANGLPSYVSFGTESAIYQENYTNPITTTGGSYTPGVTYGNAGAATVDSGSGLVVPGTGTPVQFATFELGAGTPDAFNVSTLSSYPDVTYYTIDLYSGDPSAAGSVLLATSDVLNPDQTKNDNGATAVPRSDNEFFSATVTGAASGEYVVIDGNTNSTGSNGAQVTLGGVTFGPATTPEPKTYALMLGGLGALALVARLRSRNA